MAVQFAVLSSGSRGNSTLIRGDGAAILIDAGLMPKDLEAKLAIAGTPWSRVGCVLLTHTHGDHVNRHSLRSLADRHIPIYCHDAHRVKLARFECYDQMAALGLVRSYEDGLPFLTPSGARVEPLRVPHGPEPTFGFRVELKATRRQRSVKLGYVADLGHWSNRLADALAEVDVLGLEFNYDEVLQKNSGRPQVLINRNLGDQGHLSNDQGSGLLQAVLDRSQQVMPRHVVLLHLSDQCNRPELAVKAAQATAKAAGRRIKIHASQQRTVSPVLEIEPTRKLAKRLSALVNATRFFWEDAESQPTESRGA